MTNYEIFAKAQQDYRARRIGDDEFIAARKAYDAYLEATDPHDGTVALNFPTLSGKPVRGVPIVAIDRKSDL